MHWHHSWGHRCCKSTHPYFCSSSNTLEKQSGICEHKVGARLWKSLSPCKATWLREWSGSLGRWISVYLYAVKHDIPLRQTEPHWSIGKSMTGQHRRWWRKSGNRNLETQHSHDVISHNALFLSTQGTSFHKCINLPVWLYVKLFLFPSQLFNLVCRAVWSK